MWVGGCVGNCDFAFRIYVGNEGVGGIVLYRASDRKIRRFLEFFVLAVGILRVFLHSPLWGKQAGNSCYLFQNRV